MPHELRQQSSRANIVRVDHLHVPAWCYVESELKNLT